MYRRLRRYALVCLAIGLAFVNVCLFVTEANGVDPLKPTPPPNNLPVFGDVNVSPSSTPVPAFTHVLDSINSTVQSRYDWVACAGDCIYDSRSTIDT